MAELVADSLKENDAATHGEFGLLVIKRRVVVDARASFASLSADGKLVCVGGLSFRAEMSIRWLITI